MKKSLSIIALFLFIGIQAQAQKQVLFKMLVKPNYHYDMVMKMKMNMAMDLSGDTATIKKLKNAGQSFPMVIDMETNTNMNLKTVKLNAENKIPFTMVMKATPVKMTMNGKESPVPVTLSDRTCYGTYTTDGILSLDSVAGQKTDEVTKALVKKMMEGVQSKISFPDKPMKIGDTFEQDLPTNLPMGTLASNMKAKVIYTLRSIDGNKAYFDLKGDLNMELNEQGMAMNMTGGDDGKMVYDISANFPVSMTMNMIINYNMNMPQAAGVKMNGKMKMQMEYTTNISAN